MISSLKTKSVGPIKNLDLKFGSRFNVITGDNGLGKSFLLDLIWWALTGTWAHDVNPKLMHGYMARPHKKQVGEIGFTYYLKENNESVKPITCRGHFDYEAQAWERDDVCPLADGIVLYAMPDGSFALWDSTRNKIDRNKTNRSSRQPAYIFTLDELWNGLETKDGKVLCNGIIRDWASWQKENGEAFKKLENALKHLSAGDEELRIGKLTRVDLNDARDIPSLRMPYSDEVPILYASSAIKRIISLAYLLVWTVTEHGRASELLNKVPSNQITFLIDEIDAHLHPRWQRSILPTLLEVVREAGCEINEQVDCKSAEEASQTIDPQIQIITITHSPFTLLSLEGIFDEEEDSEHDAWINIDYNAKKKEVEAKQKTFLRKGNASMWLTSEAFGLSTEFSLKKEKLFLRMKDFLVADDPTEEEAKQLAIDFDGVISDMDPLWLDFLDVCEEQGWDV